LTNVERVARRRFLAAALALLALPRRAGADASLWEALRKGGYVVLIRHASTEPGLGDPKGFRVGDCATQRNLSEAGREEARRIGRRFREERVPVRAVYTSPWCRCRDTAVLAFGRAEDWEPLSSFFDFPDREAAYTESVKQRVSGYGRRALPGNVVMVTHNVNIAALTQLSVATAEIVVVRPDGCCGLRTAGRMRVE
jgi:broad specificity phosphatase PhoE